MFYSWDTFWKIWILNDVICFFLWQNTPANVSNKRKLSHAFVKSTFNDHIYTRSLLSKNSLVRRTHPINYLDRKILSSPYEKIFLLSKIPDYIHNHFHVKLVAYELAMAMKWMCQVCMHVCRYAKHSKSVTVTFSVSA